MHDTILPRPGEAYNHRWGCELRDRRVQSMATNHLGSFDAIWETVRYWPPDDRRSLASKILASLAAAKETPSLTASPADLIGAWRNAGPLSDAAAQALLEDELMRKHG